MTTSSHQPPTSTSASGSKSASAPRTQRRTKRAGAVTSVPDKEEAPKPSSHLSDEETALRQIEQINIMARLFPSADPWGQRVETLDVILPHSISPGARKGYGTWKEMWDQFVQNRLNAAKNATSMLMLAQADAVPGVDLSGAKFYHKFTQWPWRIFTTTSTRSSTWMEPLRQGVLSSYKQLYLAVSLKDEKAIKSFTTASYQDSALRLKRSQNPNLKYVLRFHREVTPAKVLSIRATEGYLGTEEPKFGNRMMVHALVKIDTEQSLEIYDKRGRSMHPIDNSVKTSTNHTPAKVKRVTEYLVFEKRMWYDSPWIIREQLWEAPGKIVAA